MLKGNLKKKTISSVLVGSLVLGLGTAVVTAAPNSTNSVITGRTVQNVVTGVISPDKLPTLAHGATDVTLTGKIVIDGPQLVLLVNGQDVSKLATLIKVADKTWTYSFSTNVGSQIGDVTFNIDAYTIYSNGKPAGQIHTRATTVGQTVHVPFVKSYDFANLEWNSYDRVTNEFAFSYNLVKVWDDDIHENANLITASVLGTETYSNTEFKGFTITPPTVFRDFSFSTVDPIWTFNENDKTYSVSFEINKTWSNGATDSEIITREGLTPGTSNEVSLTIGEVTHSIILTVPKAPTPAIPSSVNGIVSDSTIHSIWTGNNANGGNVQESYKLIYTINGTAFTQDLTTNFTKNGTGFLPQNLTYNAKFNDYIVVVNYTLPYIQPNSQDDNTTGK